MTAAEQISELTQPHHPDDWTDTDSRAVDTARVLAAMPCRRSAMGIRVRL